MGRRTSERAMAVGDTKEDAGREPSPRKRRGLRVSILGVRASSYMSAHGLAPSSGKFVIVSGEQFRGCVLIDRTPTRSRRRVVELRLE